MQVNKNIYVFFIILSMHICYANDLQQSLNNLNNQLMSLSKNLGSEHLIQPSIKNIDLINKPSKGPHFYANYIYILSTPEGIDIKTNGKPINYKVGLIDSDYVVVENKNTKIKKVIKKENINTGIEQKIGEPIYNIVAYGPALKPETRETNFIIRKITYKEELELLKVKQQVDVEKYHIQYPTQLLENLTNHTIDPFVEQIFILEDAATHDAIMQVLENNIEWLKKQTIQMNAILPGSTETLPTYDKVNWYLNNIQNHFENEIFSKYDQGKEYDLAQYLNFPDVIETFKRLIKEINLFTETLHERNSKFSFKWKHITNNSDTVEQRVKTFLGKITPKLKIITQYLSEQQPVEKSNFEIQLNLFKKQLLQDKKQDKISLAPIKFPQETKVTTISEGDTEEGDKLLDLEDELNNEYKKYEKDKNEYIKNDENEDVKNTLQTYKDLAYRLYPQEKERNLAIGESGQKLLKWLDEWEQLDVE